MVAVVFLMAMALLYAGLGWWMWKKPRPGINPLVGYRTRRSMKSQAAWDFAQVYSGKVMLYCAAGMLLVVPLYGLMNGFADYPQAAAFMAQLLTPTLAAAILPMYLTERKLKQLFDKEGNPLK